MQLYPELLVGEDSGGFYINKVKHAIMFFITLVSFV